MKVEGIGPMKRRSSTDLTEGVGDERRQYYVFYCG